jgi:hypothetical protein
MHRKSATTLVPSQLLQHCDKLFKMYFVGRFKKFGTMDADMMMMDSMDDVMDHIMQENMNADSVLSGIHWAVSQNDAVRVKQLLRLGGDINGKIDGISPLMHAVVLNEPSVVKALLRRGAKMSTRDNTHGNTPLIEAASKGYVEIVNLLVEKGANIFECNYNGQNAYSMARYSSSNTRHHSESHKKIANKLLDAMLKRYANSSMQEMQAAYQQFIRTGTFQSNLRARDIKKSDRSHTTPLYIDPFVCSACGNAFSSEPGLAVHMRSIHGTDIYERELVAPGGSYNPFGTVHGMMLPAQHTAHYNPWDMHEEVVHGKAQQTPVPHDWRVADRLYDTESDDEEDMKRTGIRW